MKVSLIVAVAKGNNGIGRNNQLLWHLPKDMKFFRETTLGFPIITGRKNYESIPEKYRPLNDRENIVITRNTDYYAPGAHVCNSIDQAITLARSFGKRKCFIIGGGQIYKECLERNMVDEAYVTWVETEKESDTFFEGFDDQKWSVIKEEKMEKDMKNEFDFTIVKYTAKLAT